MFSRIAMFALAVTCFSDLAVSQALPAESDADEDFVPATITPGEVAAVERAERRAAAMHQLDQLAWHASDYVREHRLVQPGKFRAYVAVPRPGGGGDVYYLRKRGKPAAVVVHLDARGNAESHGTVDEIPDDVTRRAQALETARSTHPGLCTRTPNSIVLKEAEDWLVYVMSGTDDANAVLIGGHTRLRVSADARDVVESEPSANTCFALERAPKAEKGFSPKFAFLTHVRSPTPTEFHVFQSLTYRMPFVVGTSTGIWSVADGRITKLEDRNSPPQ